jgi:hypothetical protein
MFLLGDELLILGTLAREGQLPTLQLGGHATQQQLPHRGTQIGRHTGPAQLAELWRKKNHWEASLLDEIVQIACTSQKT